MRCILIIVILIIHAAPESAGQPACESSTICGIWKSIGSAGGYQHVTGNVDSLKKVIHPHTDPTFFKFQSDGVYTYSQPTANSKTPQLKTDTYKLNVTGCELILGRRRKAYKKANLKVLYVDDRYMILTNDNNPHGDFTTLYERQ